MAVTSSRSSGGSKKARQLKAWQRIRKLTGYRSGSEYKVSKVIQSLAEKNGKVLYEEAALPFSVTVIRKYIPDFIVPDKAMVIEVKGLFSQADRRKMLCVKHTYPNLDIRFVFDNPQAYLSKISRTTYAKWAKGQGFLYCATKDFPPQEWIVHKPSVLQRKAFDEAIDLTTNTPLL